MQNSSKPPNTDTKPTILSINIYAHKSGIKTYFPHELIYPHTINNFIEQLNINNTFLNITKESLEYEMEK